MHQDNGTNIAGGQLLCGQIALQYDEI